jgi:hypothetical protein
LCITFSAYIDDGPDEEISENAALGVSKGLESFSLTRIVASGKTHEPTRSITKNKEERF